MDKNTIIVIKNTQNELVAFKLERVGRYKDEKHLLECHPDAKIVLPESLPKVIEY